MNTYKIINLKDNKENIIDAYSSKQALYKLALNNVGVKDKSLAGKLYQQMLNTHKAILIENKNQLKLDL